MTLVLTRRVALAVSSASAVGSGRARAAARQAIRIGVLTDLNRPNSNGTGERSITATKLAALLLTIPDMHGIGLTTARGLLLTEAWYWHVNDRTAAFAKCYAPRMTGKTPNMLWAGGFSAITHTLKATQAMGVDKAKASRKALIAQMKAMPVEDEAYGKGSIRADGRVMNPMYLF